MIIINSIFTFLLLFNLNQKHPPGTIKIKNYYVDKTEIQNIHWLEYVYYLQKDLDSAEIQRLFPSYENFWYIIPSYRYQPIVLISYEQAVAYCKWRSKVVSEKYGSAVTYRLPSTEEWQEIAQELINTKGKRIEKDLYEKEKIIKQDSTGFLLFATKEPNSIHFNFFDNVSEMTIEKGIAVGSNNDNLTDANSNLTQLIEYNKPNAYLGFRCIAEFD